ncbi:MAG: SPOR domain-containing protein [Candidatus Puniceispirillum sp.]
MAVKGDKKGEKKWRSLLVLVFITIAAGAVTYFLMPIFLPADQNDVQIITAEEGPIKVKPDDVGGKAIKNQDSAVMSMIANNAKTDVDVENLRPLSSDPELPPVALAEEKANKVPETRTDNATDAETKAETEIKTKTETDDNTISKTASVTSEPTDADNQTSASKSSDKNLSDEQKPTSLIPTAKPAVKAKKPSNGDKKKKAKTDDPLYRVQLAAFRNADKAAEVASLLTEKHRTRLNDTILETSKIETKDNGIFWRIVTESLVREEADNLCTLLKRAGQDCILRKVKAAGQ